MQKEFWRSVTRVFANYCIRDRMVQLRCSTSDHLTQNCWRTITRHVPSTKVGGMDSSTCNRVLASFAMRSTGGAPWIKYEYQMRTHWGAKNFTAMGLEAMTRDLARRLISLELMHYQILKWADPSADLKSCMDCPDVAWCMQSPIFITQSSCMRRTS